nr:Chain A, Islet amyloid polypeptide [Homo sapiens]
NFLVHS